jgi:hypothetical protein
VLFMVFVLLTSRVIARGPDALPADALPADAAGAHRPPVVEPTPSRQAAP